MAMMPNAPPPNSNSGNAPLDVDDVVCVLAPPLPPLGDPTDEPAGVVGVNVAAVFAKHELTAEFRDASVDGADGFTVALPAKLQDAALRLVSS